MAMVHSEQKGWRRSLRKWKEKVKGDHHPKKPATPQHLESSSTSLAPPPTILFAPTTQTTISSPADPRNFRYPSSASSSPSATLHKRPGNARRNTAPADYFSSTASSGASTGTLTPINTITTTITATSPHATSLKRKSRLRLSFSKRSSDSMQPAFSSGGPRANRADTLISPTPEKGELQETKDRSQAFLQEGSKKEKEGNEEGTLVEALEIVRRDKAKEWADVGW